MRPIENGSQRVLGSSQVDTRDDEILPGASGLSQVDPARAVGAIA